MKKLLPIDDTLSFEPQNDFAFLQNITQWLCKMPLIMSIKLEMWLIAHIRIETVAQNAAALFNKLKSARFYNKTALKNSVRPAAVALAACAVLLSLGCAADNNSGVKLSDSVTVTKASPRVTAYKTIKSTELVPLSLKSTPLIFTPYATQASEKNTVTDSIAPMEGDFTDDPFKAPQCTWYVWGRVKALTGVSLAFSETSGRAARYWLRQVVQTGTVTVVSDKNAVRTHSVAVFRHGGNNEGHVVFIENVIRDSSGNPISILFSESNWGKDKAPSQKQISWNEFLSRSDDSLKGYIYI